MYGKSNMETYITICKIDTQHILRIRLCCSMCQRFIPFRG